MIVIDSVYWCSYFIWSSCVCFLVVMLRYCHSHAFQRYMLMFYHCLCLFNISLSLFLGECVCVSLPSFSWMFELDEQKREWEKFINAKHITGSVVLFDVVIMAEWISIEILTLCAHYAVSLHIQFSFKLSVSIHFFIGISSACNRPFLLQCTFVNVDGAARGFMSIP